MPRPAAHGRPRSPVHDPHLWAAIRHVQTAGLVDEVTVTRPADGYTIDPVTLAATPTPPTTIYVGLGRVQPMTGLNERRVDTGGETRTTNRYVCAIAPDAAQVLVDDVVTVTASRDPHLATRALVVRDVAYDTFHTRRILVCEDNPEEG